MCNSVASFIFCALVQWFVFWSGYRIYFFAIFVAGTKNSLHILETAIYHFNGNLRVIQLVMGFFVMYQFCDSCIQGMYCDSSVGCWLRVDLNACWYVMYFAFEAKVGCRGMDAAIVISKNVIHVVPACIISSENWDLALSRTLVSTVASLVAICRGGTRV